MIGYTRKSHNLLIVACAFLVINIIIQIKSVNFEKEWTYRYRAITHAHKRRVLQGVVITAFDLDITDL